LPYWEIDFIKVIMPSGAEGYIEQKFRRSIIDYRLWIEFDETDVRRVTTLIAGD
jgi:hypothetical protein